MIVIIRLGATDEFSHRVELQAVLRILAIRIFPVVVGWCCRSRGLPDFVTFRSDDASRFFPHEETAKKKRSVSISSSVKGFPALTGKGAYRFLSEEEGIGEGFVVDRASPSPRFLRTTPFHMHIMLTTLPRK